jgi:hypothetical protein
MPLCPQITNTPITVVQNSDFTVSSVVPAVASTYDGLAQEIDSIVVDIDGKTKAYYQATAPTGANEGDIWFDTDEGNKQYFYNGTAWVSVQDAAIAAAQATADGKNRIYRQATQPTGGTYVEGDLWFDTDDDNRIYRFTSGSWATAVELGNNAISSLSANKLTAGTIDANVITVSNINAGNISTGTLNADRIASASITGAKIAASTITTDKLIAGTLTGYTINNGSGTFSVSDTGVVSASSGTIGGFTLGATQIGDGAGTFMSTNGNMACTVLTIRASAGATGISFSNAAILGLNGGTLSMAGGTVSMAGGTINLGTGGVINSGAGTINAGTISGTGAISTTQSITATLDVTANRDLYTPNHTTVTDAANGRVTITLGRVTRSTASSQRYKENITPIRNIDELNPKRLLDIPVRAFTYREDYLSSTDSRFGALIPGFIAEEVDAVYPVAADYEDGNVESWNDRMIVPGMLALIQDLYKEIAQLKGE